jgi:hypothetical protein
MNDHRRDQALRWRDQLKEDMKIRVWKERPQIQEEHLQEQRKEWRKFCLKKNHPDANTNGYMTNYHSLSQSRNSPPSTEPRDPIPYS